MTSIQLTKLLVLLELGFKQDSVRLKSLERDLTGAMHSGRRFGRDLAMPEPWCDRWKHQWAGVQDILQDVRTLIERMDRAMDGSDPDRLDAAAEAWDSIQTQDARLLAALGQIRNEVGQLDSDIRRDWNELARTIESHLEDIHTCAQAMRLKLGLLRRHTPEQATQFVETVFSRMAPLARRFPSVPELFDKEYRQAEMELQREQHEFGGILDTLRSLVMWVESPEDRMLRNRSLQVSAA
jgi:hypothetical protein